MLYSTKVMYLVKSTKIKCNRQKNATNYQAIKQMHLIIHSKNLFYKKLVNNFTMEIFSNRN